MQEGPELDSKTPAAAPSGAFICGQMTRRIAICESHASCGPLSSTQIVCTHANEHTSSAVSPIPHCAEQTSKHPK